MAKDFNAAIDGVLARDARYHRDAYHFLREALDHTHARLMKLGEKAPRHVSGQELLGGIRDYALEQYGPMARLLLAEWGITRCEDFGELVFNLIEEQVLSKTDQDRREDFTGGYTFADAFDRPFLPQCRQPEVADEAPPSSSGARTGKPVDEAPRHPTE